METGFGVLLSLHFNTEPLLCHSFGGSAICHQVNQGDQDLTRQFMLGNDEQMQPRFVCFQNFAQGFGFASREAIF